MLIFFSVVTAIAFGSHAWLAARFAGGAPAGWRWPIWGLAMLNAAVILGGQLGGRLLPDGAAARAVSTLGYLSMGLWSLVFAAMLSLELARQLAGAVDWLARLLGHTPPSEQLIPDPSRRQALAGLANLGALSLSTAAGGAAWLGNRRPAAVVPVTIPIEGLPASLDGFRIAQISDIHIGPTIKGDFLADVVARVNALEPDLIAVTGDLVDGSVAALRRHTAPLADLRARHGAFFVTGNHEYYSGVEPWVAEIRRLGLTVLLNEHRLITHGGGRLLVGGVTDLRGGDILPTHASSPALAAAGAPDADLRLLLAHQPGSVFAADAAGFDVQLSGHTHGGQYFPGTALIHLVQPVVKGLERVGRVWIYVSCGTGWWGPPFRLGSRAEITEVTLRRASPR